MFGRDTLPSTPEIDRAHRLLAAKPAPGQRPRPVILQLHRFQVKELLIREATRRGKLDYRGQQIRIRSIISVDQTGFIKNRYSYFNIRRVFDIFYTSSNDTPECVLSLDAEKAFDLVEWGYLFAVLENFNFGPVFIAWIKLLYHCPTASVLTNSQQSQPFNLMRGTRQGCPLSPLLFNLAIEPLEIALRSGKDISGISRSGS